MASGADKSTPPSTQQHGINWAVQRARPPPQSPCPRTFSAEQAHCIVRSTGSQRLPIRAPLQACQLHRAGCAALGRVPAHAHAPAAAAACVLQVPDARGTVAGRAGKQVAGRAPVRREHGGGGGERAVGSSGCLTQAGISKGFSTYGKLRWLAIRGPSERPPGLHRPAA